MFDASWARLAWCQFCQVSLTIFMVWFVVRLWARHRPQLAYLLWMLVVMKCVTPPILDSPLGLFSWIPYFSNSPVSSSTSAEMTKKRASFDSGRSSVPSELNHIDHATFGVRSTGSELSATPDAAFPRVFPAKVVRSNRALGLFVVATVVIWLMGVLAIVGSLIWKWSQFRRELQSGPETAQVEKQVRELAARLSLWRIPRVVFTSVPTVPAVFGFLRPTIVLPEMLLNLDTEVDLEPILAHELVHVRRADPLAGRIQLFVQALWWFHPLVWWANFETRRERERSCDEMVITLMGYDPLRYANCLVKIAELSERFRAGRPQWEPVGVAAIGSFRLLANRLEHITTHATSFRRRIQLHYFLAASVFAALLLPGAANSLLSHSPKVVASDSSDRSLRAKVNPAPADQNIRGMFLPNDKPLLESVVHAPVLRGIAIDGNLDDWPSTMPRHAFFKILANGAKSWEGADFSTSPDLSCAFMVGYCPEEQLLYVSVIVRDDKLIIGHDSHRGTDAVELYVDGLRSRRTYPWRGGSDHLWFEKVGLRELPVQQYCAIPGDGPVYGASKKTNPLLIAGDLEQTKTKMAFTRSGDIIVYEWAVQVFDRYPDQPTKLELGKRIGFEIAVVDKDVPLVGPFDQEPEGDQRAWIYWGPNWHGAKVLDAGSLGEIVLGD